MATHHLETALLLRVPMATAEQIRKQLASTPGDPAAATAAAGGMAAPPPKEDKQASVKLTFTTSEGQVQFQLGHDPVMTGQLVNLPSVLEVQKTFDQIHYYKVADIGQMLIIQPPTGAASAAASGATGSLTANPARPKTGPSDLPAVIPIDHPSGLTPPTRDIRPKRYERTTAVPQRIVKEVDSQLASLKDEKPVHTFELLEEEEEVEIDEEEEERQRQQEEQQLEEDERRRRQQQEYDDEDARMDGTGDRRDTSERGRTPQTGARTDTAGRPLTGARTSQRLATPGTSGLASPQMATPQYDRAGPGGTTGVRPATQDPHKSMFGSSSPQVHGDGDIADMDTSDGQLGGGAGGSIVAHISSINVEGVENMFGSPAIGGSASAGTMADFLPETPHTPVVNLSAIYPTLAASAAPPSVTIAPPSAIDLLRGELAEVEARVEKATKVVADAKNLILKKQAQAKLDVVLAEKAAVEGKMAAAATAEAPMASPPAPAAS